MSNLLKKKGESVLSVNHLINNMKLYENFNIIKTYLLNSNEY